MATQTTASSAAAKRYATALIETAADAKALEAVEKDILSLEGLIAESQDFQKLLTSPVLNREDQQKALEAIAKKGKAHALTCNFLLLLAENRRLNILSGIIGAVKNELSKRRGELNATVQVARELNTKQLKALEKSISEAVGQAVALRVEVQQDLIGGMVVTVGSRMIDDSVKRKLDRLQQAMKSGSNQNTKTAKAV